jgi:hypothetical protein
LLAAFTMSFELSEDPEVIKCCLDGFRLSTHIASNCYVEDALETLVDSFAKFTRLRTVSTWSKEKIVIREKNKKCTQALINCAIEDRNFLKGAWEIVLAEISGLEKLDEDGTITADLTSIMRLFSFSSSLDTESIVEFTRAMVQVATTEIEAGRHFMLRKLQEVAGVNMDRSMYFWRDIWKIMSRFFTTTGCSTVQIAEFSVGIILWLARRFLAREEMAQFHFQEEFLQPFVDIMERQTALKVQDLIVDCIDQILRFQGTILQSGWAIVFHVLNHTFAHKELTEKGYSILLIIVSDHLLYVKPYLEHLVTVLSSFVINDTAGVVAPDLVRALERVARTLTISDVENWISLFQTLSRCIGHPAKAVREAVEEAFISIVINNGCTSTSFNDAVWRHVLTKTLFSLFPSNDGTDRRAVPFLKDLFRRIFEPYIDLLNPYIGIVLNLLQRCCGVRAMRPDMLECLESFVKLGLGYFASDENLTVLIDVLKHIVPDLTDSVYFVEVLAEFLSLFASDITRAARFAEIMALFEKECARVGSLACRCRARYEYFSWIVARRKSEEAAHYFRDSIIGGICHTDPEWEELTVGSLALATALPEDDFASVIDPCLDPLCDLIEAKSDRVRKGLATLMSRKLNIK